MSVYQPTYRDPATGKQRKSGTWWYEFTVAGRRIRESANTTRKTLAQEAERKRRLEIERAAAGLGTVEQRTARLATVREATKNYLADHAVNHRPASTTFARSCFLHIERLLGDRLLTECDEKTVRKYIKTRQDEGAAGRSVNAEVGELSRAIAHARGSRVTARMLWPNIRKLEENHDVGRALTREEEARLLAAIPDKGSIGVFLRIALATGMRRGEILGLTWERLDLDRQELTVGKAKTAAGTGRRIPINRNLAAVLEVYRDHYRASFGDVRREWFVFPWGSPVPSDPTRPTLWVSTAWENVRKRAGIQCRLHDLRHTAISRMAEAGVPDTVIMAIAGHVSRAMMMRYSHMSMEAKRRAVEVLGPVSDGVPKDSPKETVRGGLVSPLTH